MQLVLEVWLRLTPGCVLTEDRARSHVALSLRMALLYGFAYGAQKESFASVLEQYTAATAAACLRSLAASYARVTSKCEIAIHGL